MFIDMRIQWAFTMLGCLAVLLAPLPIYFYYYGAKLREKSRFAPTFSAQAAPASDNSNDSEDVEDAEKEKHAEADAKE